MNQQDNHPHLDPEYTQINNNIRFLAEVRFKLLALLPALGGAAVPGSLRPEDSSRQ
jgi:hypothetical protein